MRSFQSPDRRSRGAASRDRPTRRSTSVRPSTRRGCPRRLDPDAPRLDPEAVDVASVASAGPRASASTASRRGYTLQIGDSPPIDPYVGPGIRTSPAVHGDTIEVGTVEISRRRRGRPIFRSGLTRPDHRPRRPVDRPIGPPTPIPSWFLPSPHLYRHWLPYSAVSAWLDRACKSDRSMVRHGPAVGRTVYARRDSDRDYREAPANDPVLADQWRSVDKVPFDRYCTLDDTRLPATTCIALGPGRELTGRSPSRADGPHRTESAYIDTGVTSTPGPPRSDVRNRAGTVGRSVDRENPVSGSNGSVDLTR